jgi:hypothetical protein
MQDTLCAALVSRKFPKWVSISPIGLIVADTLDL